jgi:hypothetical protein
MFSMAVFAALAAIRCVRRVPITPIECKRFAYPKSQFISINPNLSFAMRDKEPERIS